MIIGLGFDYPHLKIIIFDKFSKWNIKISKKNSKSKKGYGKKYRLPEGSSEYK